MNKGERVNLPKDFKVYEYSLPFDLPLSRTILAVVDMQNDFIHPQGILGKEGVFVDGFEDLVSKVGTLMGACRMKGLPVIATRHIIQQDSEGLAVGGGLWVELRPFLKTGGFRRGSWGADLVDGLPKPDYVIEKTRFSAFFETNMECLLRGLKTEVIIFSGVATNVCVESTIRDAFFRDFKPIIIEDCVAAYTQQAHEASLRNLRFFGSVISLSELMKAFKNS